MEVKTYFLLSSLFLLLGILSINKNNYIKWFLFLVIILPSADFLKDYFFRYQNHASHFFFYPFIVVFFKHISKKALFLPLVGVTTIVLFSLLVSAMNNRISTYFIFLDIKPLLLFLVLVAFVIHKGHKISGLFQTRFFKRLLVLNFFIDAFLFAGVLFFDLNTFFSEDKFFSINSYRYSDIGVVILFIYALDRLSKKSFIVDKSFLFALFPILFSFNRSMILIIILIFLFKTLKRLVIKPLNPSINQLIFLSCIVFAITSAFIYLQNSRLTVFLNVDLLSEFFQNRFSPFYETLKTSSNAVSSLLGHGLGFAYEIPWFEYRDNINNKNIYLDNLILTLWGKYGLISFVLLTLILFFMLREINNKKFRNYMLISLLFLSLTNAWLYQVTLPLYFISPYLTQNR